VRCALFPQPVHTYSALALAIDHSNKTIPPPPKTGHRLLLDAVEAGHEPSLVLICPEAFDAPRGQQLQGLLESLPASVVTLTSAPLVAAACDTVSPQVCGFIYTYRFA
jgi:hypothetical protein